MPYRALEAIHSDVNPLAEEFSGQLLSEGEGKFLVIGKGGILSNADAKKYGLVGSALVEHLQDGQAQRENEERNAATYGAQAFTVQSAPEPAPVETTPEPEPVVEPQPVAEPQQVEAKDVKAADLKVEDEKVDVKRKPRKP